MPAISTKLLTWLEQKRGISGDTASRMGVYSARLSDDEKEIVPSETGNVIAFPFFERGKVVAEKYRAANRGIWYKPNGKKTFYNADVLEDPALLVEQSLVITQDEIDCLSALEAGYPFTVSVPDGALPARDRNGKLIVVPETKVGIDQERDDKFRFIENNFDRLDKIRKFVIAVDDDESGRRLAAELVRRLGRPRCYFVKYPIDMVCDDGEGGKRSCKDLNEVLVNFGGAEIVRMISTAQEYPVSGVYRLSQFPREPEFETFTTGWGRLDEFLKLYYPALMVITGFAGAGKSSWANQLVANLAILHGWNIGIASFEMRIRPYVTDTLSTIRIGKPKSNWTDEDREIAASWMEEKFAFIAPDPDDDATHDIDWIISRAVTSVIRHGIRVLLIDPWNEIDHIPRRNESMTDYVGRALKLLKTFGRRHDCLVIVVAHPTKSGAEKGPDRVGLYDVSDSAHFANKPDLGVVVCRKGNPQFDYLSEIMVRKVKYQPDAGRIGSIDLAFDRDLRIFSQ